MPQKPKKRPNIVLFITDQQYADTLSCVGNEYVHTPNIDSIAERGVFFEKAYCTNPVCIASRISMFTGRYPHEAGIYANINAPVPQIRDWDWLAKILKKAGYETAFIGKWHMVLDPEKDGEIHGFDFVPFGKMYSDHLVHMGCEDFLQQKRNNPFFMVASFIDPHDICGWARGGKLYNGEIGDPPLPEECPPLPEDFSIPEDEPEVLRKTRKRFPSHHPTKNWDDEKWRQYLWANYRLIEIVDKRIGKVLETLKTTGNFNESVFFFVSDHGEGMARHHWNQKQALWETPTRIPFVIANGKNLRSGPFKSKYLVSTGLDIFPTICDYAGAQVPKGIRGYSLRPLVESADRCIDRKYIVTESMLGGFQDRVWEHEQPEGRMVRSYQFKYIVYSEGLNREQFFDLKNDPHENKNLMGDKRFEKNISQHKEWLKTWCEKTNDEFPSSVRSPPLWD